MLEKVLGAVSEPRTAVDGPPRAVFGAALATGASFGIAAYGGAIHAAGGVREMAGGALRALFSAGVSWSVAIPALVVLSALTGSTVPWRRAVLASLVAVNFGGMAFMASIPVILLLEISSPFPWTHSFVNTLCVFAVGGSSTLIFERTMAHLEGRRQLHRLWMGVFGLLFLELAWLVDLFRFTH